MNQVSDISSYVLATLSDLGSSLVGFLGQLLVAVILFVVFWVVGASLGRLLAEGVKALKIDALLAKVGADKVMQRAGINLNIGLFLGEILKWFFIISGLLVAANVLGLSQVSSFLSSILLYVPNIVVAAVILIAGVIVADFIGGVVASSISAAGLKSAPFVSKVAKWAIFIFAFIAALDQLGIAQTFINTLYIGIVAMIALAGGLAFGLGGKEHASEFIAKLKRDVSNRS